MSAESFDCCSSFKKCSDALECVHKDNSIFDVCTYRKKLEAGIVFYGKNTNVFEPIRNGKIPENIILRKKEKSKPGVYLTCYKRPFLILKRTNIWSYKLNEESTNAITTEFNLREIPYRTSLELYEDLPGDDVDVIGPCNSRVVFKVGDAEYHILNFNSYLIQSWYADKINKSLAAKGIESRVELVGIYASGKCEVNSITKNLDIGAPVKTKAIKTDIPSAPVQITLFDLAEFASPAQRRL